MAVVTDDVDGFDDVRVFKCGTNTKFSSNFLLVLFFGLARPFRPELLNSEDIAIVLPLDKPNGTTGTRTQDPAPFAVLLCKMGLCGFGERLNRMRDMGGRFTVRGCEGGMRSMRVAPP